MVEPASQRQRQAVDAAIRLLDELFEPSPDPRSMGPT